MLEEKVTKIVDTLCPKCYKMHIARRQRYEKSQVCRVPF